MIELISIPDRTDFTSTKATEVTFTPEVITRALLRALLQLSVLYSVVSTFHKLLKISQKVYRNFFKCCLTLLQRNQKENFVALFLDLLC